MNNFALLFFSVLLLVNCFDSSTNTNTEEQKQSINHIKKGREIAMNTFSTLGGNLQKAMKEGGVSSAVKYCNLAASPLVDSLQQMYNVSIKRTSLKLRNQDNHPTEIEKQQLEKYQQQFELGEKLSPVIHKVNEQTIFYAPIHVTELCQKCHGAIGKQLLTEDYETIQSLYPKDMAINYKSGDLRGMWSITFYDENK